MKPVFDANQWYNICLNNDTSNVLIGTSLFQDNKRGATFMQSADSTKNTQKWQFYAIDNSGTYVLRSKDGGRNGFMGAYYNRTEGQTVVSMLRIDENPGDTIYWTLQSSTNADTYFMFSKANGTSNRLTIQGTTTLMDKSEGESNPQQQFSFETVEVINDDAFSTVDLQSTLLSTPATSATSFATPTSTASKTKTHDPTSTSGNDRAAESNSGSLSTGAKAAIGASIGGVVLIALVVLGLLFWKKRRARQPSYQPTKQEPGDNLGPYVKAELAGDEQQYAQYGPDVQYELDGHEHAHRMPELATNELTLRGG